MKLIITIVTCFLFVAITYSQGKYLTKSGAISFYSKATMEDISADNNQVLSIIDTDNSKMAISILMKSFLFEKALMQEHFNENYVESDKYPKATFKGEILNFDTVNDMVSKKQVKGFLTIHGVSKEITIDANMTKKENSILVTGDFMISLEDFNVKIPAVVAKNIAKKIKVTFNLNHQFYKK
ncbi:YceI family protein [Polaribacter vadi]|uniref:YceI family protein n=1 Tax=Polaribacter TaxID=52959 RepID=UPI001C08EA85|nr:MULTISPECIES: YceI family protein [Polaribacter]MBU3012109.1 YceI family protein [Polaribacter vadi]MDO6741925.1 YceI family protein [Polaribacter sp. 1_MG-2023]